MDILATFVTPGVVFLLTLCSGVWLSHSGRPLNTAIFTIHKLIALAVVIITALKVNSLLNNTAIQVPLVALLILAGLCAVTLFASGAILSRGKPANDILLTIHKLTPFVAVLAMVATIYLLATG